MSCITDNITDKLLRKGLVNIVYNKLVTSKDRIKQLNFLQKEIQEDFKSKYDLTTSVFRVEPILGYFNNGEVEAIYGKDNLYEVDFNNDSISFLDNSLKVESFNQLQKTKTEREEALRKELFERMKEDNTNIKNGEVSITEYDLDGLPMIELVC